jgi:hypothetical protein
MLVLLIHIFDKPKPGKIKVAWNYYEYYLRSGDKASDDTTQQEYYKLAKEKREEIEKLSKLKDFYESELMSL